MTTVHRLRRTQRSSAAREDHDRAPGARPARHPDRHRLRRHLPLRHPHGARRLGPAALPARARSRDRRNRRRGRRRGDGASRVGDRVGVGCLVNSCGECRNCQRGDEQFCAEGAVFTYGSTDRDGTITQGGYSRAGRRDRVVRRCASPTRSPLDGAAPLLCAGITTYSPLRHWNVGPGTRVAVVGLGGLGHMAVQIAHALGAEVTVLSQTLSKKDDGLRLGADHYFATSDPETFSELRGSFDVILNTVSAVDRPARLPRAARCRRHDGLRRRARRTAAGAGRCRSSAGAGRSPARTSAASRETQEMLDFCAEHGIAAEIEVIPASRDQRPPTSGCSPRTCGTGS